MKQFAALLRKDNQPVRYLVVDDSVFARKNLIKMIEMFGGEVAGEAGDGLTAIAEFNRISPDIVLMDITMPQMEGSEAFRTEAGEAGSVVRNSPVRAERRSQRRRRPGGARRRTPVMRMELIQPFINAADAVFAESLQGPTKIVDLEMDEDA